MTTHVITFIRCDECGDQYHDDNADYGLPPATPENLAQQAEGDGWDFTDGWARCDRCVAGEDE